MAQCDECQGYLNPALAVDACVRRGDDILLVQRKFPPSAGSWVLPGGFVDQGERPEEAVLRELSEEAGLEGRNPRLLMVMGDPQRDPRKHIVSIVYEVDAKVNQKEAMMRKMLDFGQFQTFSKDDLSLQAIMEKSLNVGSINQFRANEIRKLLTGVWPFWQFKCFSKMQSCKELSMKFLNIITAPKTEQWIAISL